MRAAACCVVRVCLCGTGALASRTILRSVQVVEVSPASDWSAFALRMIFLAWIAAAISS
jgi:hypothetical protein